MDTLKIILVVIFSVLLYINYNGQLIRICETDTCPFCFGTDLCREFEEGNIVLTSNTLVELFSNYISVKNVFYGSYINKSIVLKKLGHNYELDFQLNKGDLRVEIVSLLIRSNGNFKVCSVVAAEKLYDTIVNKLLVDITHFWTFLQVNAEPLILRLLKAEDYWPVPAYLGACGRLIVQSHCGSHLNSYSNYDWHLRSKLALQVLHAVKNFTERHNEFRFYLTDISPDNIAVDDDFKVTFVDLENVIVTDKTDLSLGVHFSDDFGEDFAFSEFDLCHSSISDHNYFAVCKLILSKDAPWPMMTGGLLHSPPGEIIKKYSNLFTLIESCAHKTTQINCFNAIDQIFLLLEKIVHGRNQ